MYWIDSTDSKTVCKLSLFSMYSVKKDFLSSIQENILDDLIMIVCNGMAIYEYNQDAAITWWCENMIRITTCHKLKGYLTS